MNRRELICGLLGTAGALLAGAACAGGKKPTKAEMIQLIKSLKADTAELRARFEHR